MQGGSSCNAPHSQIKWPSTGRWRIGDFTALNGGEHVFNIESTLSANGNSIFVLPLPLWRFDEGNFLWKCPFDNGGIFLGSILDWAVEHLPSCELGPQSHMALDPSNQPCGILNLHA